MRKSILKIFYLSSLVLLIGLIYSIIAESYYDYRLNLYDLNMDGIFDTKEEILPRFDYFSRILYGRQFYLGLIMLIPYVYFVVTFIVILFEFLKKKDFKFIHKIVTKLDSPITKRQFEFQFLLCIVIEIITGIVFYIIYKSQTKLFFDESSFFQIPLKTLYFYSFIYYIFTIVGILLFKLISNFEPVLRLLWLYFIFIQIDTLLYQGNNITKESYIFILLPVSSLIPSICISLKKIKCRQVLPVIIQP